MPIFRSQQNFLGRQGPSTVGPRHSKGLFSNHNRREKKTAPPETGGAVLMQHYKTDRALRP